MRKGMILTIGLAAVALLGPVSCAKRQLVKLDAEGLMGRGQRYYEAKKYEKAAQDFKEVIFNYSGTRVAAEASYLAAECSYAERDYETSAEEYQQLLADYPSSEHAEEAQIRLAESYFGQSPNYALDQSETGDRALAAIGKFFEKYPESPLAARAKGVQVAIEDKLARKDFEAGKFYLRRKMYPSARIYLEGIVKEYPQTRWAPQARQLLASLPAAVARPATGDTSKAAAPQPRDTVKTPAPADTATTKSPWK